MNLLCSMTLPENDLGIRSVDQLVEWTASYVHFKQALEVIDWPPERLVEYLEAFPKFQTRYKKELIKQGHLEARLPKSMRDKIAATKPNLLMVKSLLLNQR